MSSDKSRIRQVKSIREPAPRVAQPGEHVEISGVLFFQELRKLYILSYHAMWSPARGLGWAGLDVRGNRKKLGKVDRVMICLAGVGTIVDAELKCVTILTPWRHGTASFGWAWRGRAKPMGALSACLTRNIRSAVVLEMMGEAIKPIISCPDF
ncbi:hypothetical protein BDV93DRAFT_503732 [Ceratobasidium sp. AG-I]|nr:hypothetical protein BDV93DRAFT_503732 [Ceratobasidium sp. AG-I]